MMSGGFPGKPEIPRSLLCSNRGRRRGREASATHMRELRHTRVEMYLGEL